jgi:hypothetical protein
MNTQINAESGFKYSTTPGLQLPSLFPDIQWLRIALHAETLLLADNTTFSRKSRSHRGKIRTPDGFQWIHIPLLPNDRSLPLASARIDQRSDWLTPLWRALEFNYRNSIYFELYEPELQEFFEKLRSVITFREGCDLVLNQLQSWLEIQLPPVLWLSEYASDKLPLHEYIDTGVPILIEIDSRNYLTPVPGCVYPSADLPEYRQHFGGFESNCCWLDLLFERGPESWEYMDRLKIDI